MAIFYTDSASFDNITVTQNLSVLGTSSATYTQDLVVESNTIKLGNNQTLRYAGVEFVDSGSTPITSASILFDSTNNQMLFQHNGGVTSSVFLLGPETYNNLGNEIYLTANRLPKGTGIEHLADSNITDTGTLVSIVGPLSASGGITGSGFLGTASSAVSSSYALSASFAPSSPSVSSSYAVTSSFAVSASYAPSSPSVSASYAETSSFAISASWAPAGAGFPFTGDAVITGSLIVTGSTLLGAVQSTSVLDVTNPETLYVSASNTNAMHVHGVVNDFMQIDVMNMSAGTNASADYVATADNGTDTGNYIDLGINSSGYTGGMVGAASDGYLYLTSSVGELHIGNASNTANSNVRLFTGGPSSDANTRMFISSSGRIGVNITGSLLATLHVSGSIHSINQTVMSSGSINAAGSPTITLNMLNANYFYISASGAGTVTWATSNVIVAPNVQAFILEYTGGGQKTNNWFTNTRWPGGTAPTLSSTGVDLIGFITDDAGGNWRAALLQRNSS